MPKFRKKPVVIEAVQLTWANWSEICAFAGVGNILDGKPEGCYVSADGKVYEADGPGRVMGLRIPTLEEVMVARESDWIIRGVKGELYACKPDIFAATYEPVEGESDA